jgi:two-component system response regulator AtoC
MQTGIYTSDKLKICVFEEDTEYLKYLTYTLSLINYSNIISCSNIENLSKELEVSTEVLLITCIYNDFDKIDNFFKLIKKINLETKIIVVSGIIDSSIIFQCFKNGVIDFIEKNGDTKNKLINRVNSVLVNENKITQAGIPKLTFKKQNVKSFIIGNSPAIRKIDGLIEKASKSMINVLITGETGTGKELVAKFIHQDSVRGNHPLITVNMAAIPKELIESELFGHEKGAFTGASNQRIGKFESATNGTLFLDEIGEMDYSLQAKILRVLQEKEIVRVGGNKTIKINCRIIAATNRNLQEEIHNGNFREDLYFRLYGLCIELPPLRERGNDKILIAEKIIENYCKENNLPITKMTEEAKEKINAYSFPGNIRELKSCIELAIVMSNGVEILPSDIQLNKSLNITSLLTKEKTMDEYQKHIVKHFLDRYNKNVVKVAERLSLGKSTIYRMIKENEEYFYPKK